MAKDITKISQEARTKAYFNNTPASNATLARRYGKSVRTIQRWRQTGKVPKSNKKLNRAIQRTGKKYAKAEKKEAIKKAVINKYDRLIAESETQLKSSTTRAVRRGKQRDIDSLKEAKRIAQSQSLEELVGMTGDLRTDSDWREWEANYNSVKGSMFV